MTSSDPVTHLLDVPGARLYYERRRAGVRVRQQRRGSRGTRLVTAHAHQVRTLVANEPPVVELLPDAASSERGGAISAPI
jgi:hypothetical protein